MCGDERFHGSTAPRRNQRIRRSITRTPVSITTRTPLSDPVSWIRLGPTGDDTGR